MRPWKNKQRRPSIGKPLTVTVSDGGYAGAGGTRTTESGYKTNFTEGDKIGVITVMADCSVNELANNLWLTFTDDNGTLTWKSDYQYMDDEGNWATDQTDLPSIPGATNYAYYPYIENEDNFIPKYFYTSNFDVSKTTADEVLAKLITKWTVKDDQSDYADYAASDLMVAKGEVCGSSITFSMSHAMSLIAIDLPKTVYQFTNEGIADYTVSSAVTWSSPDSFNPCCIDGTYRKIVKHSSEATTIAGTYNGSNYFTANVETPMAGSYTTLKVDGAAETTKEHTLQVGDYYMNDGSLLPSGTELTDEQKNNCIGIVFALDSEYDKSSYPSAIHGYVVALQDANSSTCIWSSDTGLDIEGVTNYDYTPDWSGYGNTQAITNESGYSESTYPAAYYAKTYTPAAPAGTSGWFLPAVDQLGAAMKAIYITDGSVKNSYGNAGGLQGACYLG